MVIGSEIVRAVFFERTKTNTLQSGSESEMVMLHLRKVLGNKSCICNARWRYKVHELILSHQVGVAHILVIVETLVHRWLCQRLEPGIAQAAQ